MRLSATVGHRPQTGLAPLRGTIDCIALMASSDRRGCLPLPPVWDDGTMTVSPGLLARESDATGMPVLRVPAVRGASLIRGPSDLVIVGTIALSYGVDAPRSPRSHSGNTTWGVARA